jgi:hypothetical protein
MEMDYNKPYIYSTPENIGLKNTDIIAKEWEQILNRNQPLIIDLSISFFQRLLAHPV